MWSKLWPVLLVAACLTSVVAGIGLFIYTGSWWWLWLCLPIVIFLS